MIGVLYGGFAVMMLGLVFKASSEDFSLVSNDYYQEGVNFEQRIDKEKNSSALKDKLTVAEEQGKILVQFPHEMSGVSGKILLYRPTSSKEDRPYAVSPNKDNAQIIPTDGMAKGVWHVQVDWAAGGKGYYDEQTLYLN